MNPHPFSNSLDEICHLAETGDHVNITVTAYDPERTTALGHSSIATL